MSNRTDKPWGYEELLTLNDIYAIKLLVINEGHCLSLQYHQLKRETWYILSGEGAATVGDKMFSIKPGMTIDLPPETVHRVFAGRSDVVIFEVSTPELDDVVRVEDDYGRTQS